MSDSHINYRENYFQHPSLTKISGDPTYASLAKLERECKANGKSVSSTLGGGNQGHLGLVCSPAAYNRVSPGVPFNRPALPILPNLDLHMDRATSPLTAPASPRTQPPNLPLHPLTKSAPYASNPSAALSSSTVVLATHASSPLSMKSLHSKLPQPPRYYRRYQHANGLPLHISQRCHTLLRK
jgi:hypothetical protein